MQVLGPGPDPAPAWLRRRGPADCSALLTGGMQACVCIGVSNREIVSCCAVRAYERARGVLGQVRFQPKRPTYPLVFQLFPACLSLFLYETIYFLFPCDQDFLLISRFLVISLISMIPMSPSES